MEEPAALALRAFNVKSCATAKIRGALIVTGETGKRSLIKTGESLEHIMFSHRIKTTLTEGGFPFVDTFTTTVEGLPYFTHNGENYILTSYIDSENINFSDNNCFLKVVEAVAKAHRIFIGSSLENNPRFEGHDLLATFQKSLGDMAKMKKRAVTGRTSEFDILFLKNYYRHREKIQEALDILKNSPYPQKLASAKKDGGICHNLLKKENIFNKNGEIYITNFSAAAVDYYMKDLSELIKRYLRYRPERRLSPDTIIESYGKFNNITKIELSVLRAMLLYPQSFVNAASMYYAKKRNWTPGAFSVKINEALEKGPEIEEYSAFF